jgi:hypothetical protein
VEPQLDDTQGMDVSIGVDQEIAGLLERLQLLLAEDDPRHRLLAAVASMWHDLPASAQRFQAAANLLTLDQRDVWFLAASDPVEAMDEAVSRLLIALGDAVTAAGANFYFDTGEPFTPAGNADQAYRQLGDAIRQWKAEVLQERRLRGHVVDSSDAAGGSRREPASSPGGPIPPSP